ncbi:MAG: hypothetical protein FGM24_04870 [Candidatus Kapabacteria bacterium]|nr:hypothetical protein [Candidatus Kapabacteria bacterium]
MLKEPRIPETFTTGTTFCEGDTATIAVSNPTFLQYRWSTGSTSSVIWPTESGTYRVEALDTNGCWSTSESITLTFNKRPTAELTVSGPTTFCLDDSVVISLKGSYASYVWSNGATTPSLTVKQPGTFFVIVTDVNGCVDTSEVLAIDVIQTRNKIELLGLQRPFVVGDHDVGSRACADIRIRNRSTDETLVIARPILVNNTTFGIPPSQLPIIIPPGQDRQLTVCCAAVDTGMVADTIFLPDTCSPSVIPVVSRGLPYDLLSSSRCDVATQVTVIRAGLSYRTSPPYPIPADKGALFSIVMPRGSDAPDVTLRDATLREIRRVEVTRHDQLEHELGWTYSIRTDDLPAGLYVLVATSPLGVFHTVPIPVLH